jgi:hypothetical protein
MREFLTLLCCTGMTLISGAILAAGNPRLRYRLGIPGLLCVAGFLVGAYCYAVVGGAE